MSESFLVACVQNRAAESVIVAEIDPGRAFEARRMIPALRNGRSVQAPAPVAALRASA